MNIIAAFIVPLLMGLTMAEQPATAQSAPTVPKISFDQALKLSPLALQLAECGEDAAGIRTRLELILAHMAQEAESYEVHGLTVPKLELIPIQVQRGDGRHLGGAQWAASNRVVMIRMTFFTSPLPAATNADSRLLREMTLNDTLAHELAHCFFYSRYPKLAKMSSGLPFTMLEGHAIHAARSFIQRHYFSGAPMPREYYEKVFLSPRYTRIYRAFLATCTDEQGRIRWPQIDAAELREAPPGYTLRNRVQQSGF